MSITYQSQGDGEFTESSGTALTPPCPASVSAGHILIAHVFFEGLTEVPSTPSGWTLLFGPRNVGGDPGNSVAVSRNWVYGKIADGSEGGTSPDFGSNAVTSLRAARIYSFAGRVSGTIKQLVHGFTSTISNTDPPMPTVRTTKAGALAVALVSQNDNNALASATGESGGDWTEAVAEFTANGVPGCVLQIQTATPTGDPGTITGGTVAATDDPACAIGFQIIDEPPTDGILLVAEGEWARLVVDGSVLIPVVPEVGDRMFLFASWKDFSITVTNPSGWTPIGSEFADGTTSAGAGTGSVKVMAWYRDYQDGDGNPSIDWSSNPTEGHTVITVWRKGSDVTWDTPLTVTAAQTTWTTTQQTTSASSTVDVPDGSVVMGLHGVRDNSNVFTHPSTGIDDSGAAITWEAGYHECPWVNFNSDVGLDMSGDLGHRFVTTGASGVTLRQTGTLSAADTGAMKWVVQGVTAAAGGVTVTPSTIALSLATFAAIIKHAIIVPVKALTTSLFAPVIGLGVVVPTASLTISTFAPTVTKTDHQLVTPTTATLTTSAFAPVIGLAVIPGAASLTTSTFAPSVIFGTIVVPSTQSLTLAAFAPTVSTPSLVVPSTASLTIATFAPAVLTPSLVVPSPAVLSLTAFAPVIGLKVIPGAASLTTSAFAPSIGQGVVPTTVNLVTAAFAPTVSTPRLVVPSTIALTLSTFAPTISVGSSGAIVPSPASLTLTTFAPTVVNPQSATPQTAVLNLTVFAPKLNLSVIPATASLLTAAFAPVIKLGIVPGVASLSLSQFAPTILTPKLVTPTTAALTLTAFPPIVPNPRLVTPSPLALILTQFAPTINVGTAPPPENRIAGARASVTVDSVAGTPSVRRKSSAPRVSRYGANIDVD